MTELAIELQTEGNQGGKLLLHDDCMCGVSVAKHLKRKSIEDVPKTEVLFIFCFI